MTRAPGLHVESVGAGRPLVLLHGWAMHGGLFTPLLPHLAPRYRVHVVDLPGHGHSRGVTPSSVDATVVAIDSAFAEERAPIAVMGWSLGGLIALHWALVRPGRIGKLALVCTTPKFVADDAWPHAMAPATLARFGDELRVAWKQTLQRFLSLQVQGSDEGRATLAALRHELFARGEPSPKSLADALATLAALDVRSRVGSVAVPTLVVAGERDTLTPPEAAAWLAEALPAARLVRIEGAGHAPFLSHRDDFLDALIDFLDT